MGIFESLKNRVSSWGVLNATDQQINIEANARSGGRKSGGGKTAEVERRPNLFTPKKIVDWKNAIALATDTENPNFLLLDELYQNLLLDAHAVSVIESRVFRVTRSRYNLLDTSNNANPEVAELLNRPWFEQFMRHSMWSLFTGMKVLELFDTDEDGELLCTTSIPMAHIVPHKQQISKEAGEDKGTPYAEGALAKYYLQVGQPRELGILADIGIMILAKKQAQGAWLDHIEKFGIPPIIINTDNYDDTRQQKLLEMGLAMHNNHVMVLQGNETFTIGDTKTTDAHKIFQEFLKYQDSAISKRVLGQDGTTENKDGAGTYGSLQIMQEVANDRHESDKLLIEYIINKDLIPKLVGISSTYAPLANYRFAWDESDELPRDILVDKVVSLTQAGYEIDHEQIAEKTGIPITGFTRSSFTPEDGGKKKS